MCVAVERCRLIELRSTELLLSTVMTRVVSYGDFLASAQREKEWTTRRGLRGRRVG